MKDIIYVVEIDIVDSREERSINYKPVHGYYKRIEDAIKYAEKESKKINKMLIDNEETKGLEWIKQGLINEDELLTITITERKLR